MRRPRSFIVALSSQFGAQGRLFNEQGILSTHYEPPPPGPLRILYRDRELLAVDKPTGLLSVPGRGADKQDCMRLRVQREYPRALVVHRLDQPTSGLMLFALTPAAQSVLGRMFQQREIHKEYVAVVAGGPEPERGEIDLPLIADWPNRPRQRVDQEIGKPALTRYEVLAHDPAADTSRVRLLPETGRSHQLRVHMAALGHPILGDELYADKVSQRRSGRLLLHAHRLQFRHPVTGEWLAIESEVPF